MVPPAEHRWIAHVDLDAFFASCEQRDNPDYRGRPVIVGALPGQRGVVAAASYEARRFGIHSAMPIAEAYRRCPEAVYLPPDMAKYREVSRQVMRILGSITPLVETASVDEAYLDISGLDKLLGPPEQIGREIKARIQAATQLTASVGIGPNRLIAKLGSESCKPDGLTVLGPEEVLDFLAPMPITNLRGVGPRTLRHFRRLGIETIAQLREVRPGLLERELGARAAAGVRRQALGQASDDVVPGRTRKSISKERTFQTDVQAPKRLHDELRELAAAVAGTARRESLYGRIVTLKVRYTGFDTYTRRRTLDVPTHDERRLLSAAWSLFNRGDLPERAVRLIGVGLSGWAAMRTTQGDLFREPAEREPSERLLDAIDLVTEKYGDGKLRLGLPRRQRD